MVMPKALGVAAALPPWSAGWRPRARRGAPCAASSSAGSLAPGTRGAPRLVRRRVFARAEGAPRGVQVFAHCRHRSAGAERLQVGTELAGGWVAEVRVGRHGLDEDAAQRLGAGIGRRGRCDARADHALQPLGALGLVGLHAGDHLVEHDGQRPQVRAHVDLAGIEPLRRSVGHAAEFVAREAARQGERLGDAEIEHAHFAAGIDANVLGLDVAVNHAVELLAVDGDLQIVRVVQRLGDGDGDFGGEPEDERAAPHQLRQILPVDVLHGDKEEAVGVARAVDADHARIDGGEVRL